MKPGEKSFHFVIDSCVFNGARDDFKQGVKETDTDVTLRNNLQLYVKKGQNGMQKIRK